MAMLNSQRVYYYWLVNYIIDYTIFYLIMVKIWWIWDNYSPLFTIIQNYSSLFIIIHHYSPLLTIINQQYITKTMNHY